MRTKGVISTISLHNDETISAAIVARRRRFGIELPGIWASYALAHQAFYSGGANERFLAKAAANSVFRFVDGERAIHRLDGTSGRLPRRGD
jgi:hypothetical protein